MKYSLTRSSTFHPFLFAVMPVFLFVSLNLSEIVLQDVAFPLLITITAAITSWFLLNLLLKNRMQSGLLVSLGLVLFFTYGHFYNILYTALSAQIPLNIYLLIAFFLIFVAGIFIIFKTKKHYKEFTTIANGIASIIILIAVFNISAYALEYNNSVISNDQMNYGASAIDYTPNVYYIILDSYAGSTVLKKTYGFDNSDFTSELIARGFHVSKNSYSNYQNTFLSLASSLNMEYLTISDDLGIGSHDRRLIHKLWNDNKVTNIFKSYNYTTVTMHIISSFSKLSDHELCQNPYLNEASIVFWESTMLKVGTKLLNIDQYYRDKILCKFDTLSDLHNSIDEPFFVYVHFLLPHPPFVFGPNGESLQPRSLTPGATTIWEDKSKYLNQVKFANKKIIEAIDQILQESTMPPIIILQSDHGSGRLPDDAQNWNDSKKFNEAAISTMSILNVYYLPDQNTELIYDSITPVNSFRLILNAYFNENFELLDDRSYYGSLSNFTDVTDILVANSSGG